VRAWPRCTYLSATNSSWTRLLSGLIADGDDWGDGFDVAQVQEIWQEAMAGRAAARDELLLQRVVWRAAFTEHLAAVNGEPAPKRRTRTVATRPRTGQPSMHIMRRLAIRANDVPLARRMARTSVGRKLRWAPAALRLKAVLQGPRQVLGVEGSS
jgi:hypothetical protein